MGHRVLRPVSADRRQWDWLQCTAAGVCALLVLAMVVVALHVRTRPTVVPGPTASDTLIDAWERSRTATYRAVGTFERSAPDGRRLEVGVETVQRAPDRLVRQFGSVSGRRDDREVLCPAAIGDADPACTLGPQGPGFDEAVQAEIEVFRSLVSGDAAVYEVRHRDDGCWRLRRIRPDPRSGFGDAADICMDRATGAVRSIDVDHGDVDERTEYTDISVEVTDADFEP